MPDLKLLALDNEDLEVISAYVQDAVVRVEDMAFAKTDRRFALMMNRFAWEEKYERTKGQRKRSGLHFDNVDDVRFSGIDMNAREGVLELLSLTFAEKDAPAGEIVLAFAGGGTVALSVECLEARIKDLGAAWSASGLPSHDLDGKS